MGEILSGGLLGSIFGGLFRMAPEVLKWLDRKDERLHELKMNKQMIELEMTKGDIRLREIGAQASGALDVGVISAFKAAVESQTDMVKAAGTHWVAAFSASVRPVVTYWILAVWSFMHLWVALTSGESTTEVFKLAMSPDFMALVGGTVNYWFLDRTLKTRGL